ncbi:L-ornithine N5-oxygenase [Micromonospora pattaloongensis]|uniref:L-lysine N6-monooxygenase MbtG n=1 Tax=Micromonospora pattaloongensis TaxID=405436 RepID=A0A1H3JWI3_9ACTN|nr:SidA/IucD/PvdA family monooxygenase [Micromonospora pattaloongensis]SDY43865.1 L-ornithine N5-oxygenase [Micromonospora pattaloongensis]
MSETDSATVRQVVGVGFGPANLALAIAAGEVAGPDGRTLLDECVFLERQPSFGWHRGMLLDGATMQVSFLKDLATLRSPSSRYTFTSYLHDVGRLTDFINSKTLYPYRTDFHTYLEWAADRLPADVRYGTEVVSVTPERTDDVVRELLVRTGDGRTFRTRNLVIGTGMTPCFPDGVQRGPRVWHSAELLTRLAAPAPTRPRTFAVVGAGQSAAEVVEHLHATHPEADVHAIFGRFGYSMSDDSPFANQIFDPDSVDEFYHAPGEVRDALMGYHANTNYSVVDLDLIRSLHGTAYREHIAGRRRLHFHHASRITRQTVTGEGVHLDVEFLPTGTIRQIDADAIVYATGYRPSDPRQLLGDLADECKTDDRGRLALARDYRVITSDGVRCGIYVHGAAAERTHGLSAGLLSNVAVRAGEILAAIRSL